MSEFYGPSDDIESLRTVEAALDQGVTYLDTADIFGPFANESLLGEVVSRRRDEVIIGSKFGTFKGVSGRPEDVHRACDASLGRLRIDVIDIYYQFRVDPDVPVDETWGALAELVTAGKVRHLGICEASEQTIRRVHAIHPLAAVQSEYALWMRDPERNGVLSATRDLGIAFVAACPLGRKLLTGTLSSLDQLTSDDSRLNNPRFQGGTFAKNLALLPALRRVAERYNRPMAQIALAWLLAKAPNIIVIPGSRSISHLTTNNGANDLELDAFAITELDKAFPIGAAAGDRYSNMSWVNR